MIKTKDTHLYAFIKKTGKRDEVKQVIERNGLRFYLLENTEGEFEHEELELNDGGWKPGPTN